MHPKITIVGAGNVGSALAERVLSSSIADVALIDVAPGLARGKALDLSDAAPLMGYATTISGAESYDVAKGSQVVVVTAGLARKPGMSRDDLVARNSAIVFSVLEHVRRVAPDAIVLMVTNPLDIMTYGAYKKLQGPRARVFGMAGNLDTARFANLISNELGIPHGEIETCVLGSHGDTMVPVISRTRIGGKPIAACMDAARLGALVQKTKKRGGEIVGLLASGSAYFSPSAACHEILEAILGDGQKVIPCSCILDGEYGLKGCALGVPARIGRNGMSEIIEWPLSDDEMKGLKESAGVVKKALERVCRIQSN
jgi:malate dehydrogenase